MRETWDSYFMKIAKLASSRATCCRAKVGCVLVRHSRVIATGYNGALAGDEHCLDVGCDVVDNHCRRCLHSEMNVITGAAKLGIPTNGTDLYIWGDTRTFPCDICAKLIVASGVIRLVVLPEIPTDSYSFKLFKSHQIDVVELG